MLSLVAVAVGLLTLGWSPPEGVEAEITRLSRAYDAAVKAQDAGALGRLYDDEGRFVESDGRVFDKAAKIRLICRPAVTHAESASEIESIRLFGDAAVETGVWTSTGTEDGAPKTWRNRYLAVWVKRGETWVIVAEQSTDLAATGPGEEDDRAALLDALVELEERSWELAKAQDVDGLKELLPDDAVSIYADGTRYDDRAAYLATFPAIRLDAYAIDGKMALSTPAPGVATLTYRVSYAVTEEGKGNREFSAVATSTYVRRGDRWWNVLYQETPVE